MYFHFSKVERERFLFFVLSATGFFSFLRSLDKQYLFLACSRFFNFFFDFLDCVPEETPDTFDYNCINSSPARREPDDL